MSHSFLSEIRITEAPAAPSPHPTPTQKVTTRAPCQLLQRLFGRVDGPLGPRKHVGHVLVGGDERRREDDVVPTHPQEQVFFVPRVVHDRSPKRTWSRT